MLAFLLVYCILIPLIFILITMGGPQRSFEFWQRRRDYQGCSPQDLPLPSFHLPEVTKEDLRGAPVVVFDFSNAEVDQALGQGAEALAVWRKGMPWMNSGETPTGIQGYEVNFEPSSK